MPRFAPRLVLALTLLATLAACDSADVDRSGREPLDPAQLAGTWTWERTESCSDGSAGCVQTTPASTGRAETLTFTATGQYALEGVVQGYFNGQTLGPTDYTVSIGHGDGRDRAYWFASIDLAGGTGYNSTYLTGDRLVISAAAADGPETTYRRRR